MAAVATRIDSAATGGSAGFFAGSAGAERSARRTRAPILASCTSAARGRSGVRGGMPHRDAIVCMSNLCFSGSGDQPREEADDWSPPSEGADEEPLQDLLVACAWCASLFRRLTAA